jgi:hypothetical protein
MRLAAEIERLHEAGDVAAIDALRPDIEAINSVAVLEEQAELNVPLTTFHRFKVFRLVWFLLYAWVEDKRRRLSGRYVRWRSAQASRSA